MGDKIFIEVTPKYRLGDVVFRRPSEYSTKIEGGRIIEIKATLGRGIVYLLSTNGVEYHESELCLGQEVKDILIDNIHKKITLYENMLRECPIFIGGDIFEKHKEYLENKFGLDCFNTFERF